MNKRLLICGVIATALLVTACVKKEPPKEEDATQATSTAKTEGDIQFQSLGSAESKVPDQVEIPTEVNSDTLTTKPEPTATAEPAIITNGTQSLDTKPPETKPLQAEVSKSQPSNVTLTTIDSNVNQVGNTNKQSQDDAVAAAIAAAKPALQN